MTVGFLITLVSEDEFKAFCDFKSDDMFGQFHSFCACSRYSDFSEFCYGDQGYGRAVIEPPYATFSCCDPYVRHITMFFNGIIFDWRNIW